MPAQLDFAPLTAEELQELATRLSHGRDHAMNRTYAGLDDDEQHGGFNDPRYVTYRPVYEEVDSVCSLVFNERYGRAIGCRRQACGVCRHESCRYCPACNPTEIAPNGEAYGDTDDEPADCTCTEAGE